MADKDLTKASTGVFRARIWLGALLVQVAFAAILFASAGHLALPMFWAYILLHAAVGLVGTILMMTRQPGLIRERRHPGPGSKENVIILKAVGFLTWAALLIVAGLDAGRFHWSGHIPLPLRVTALAGFTAAMVVAYWTVIANPFASSVIRLQTDRAHYVVTAGPYRWVRHPMYIALMCTGPLSAIALGSWWAILPAAPSMLLVIRRTAKEDRFLQANLERYGDYAQRVRYRLIPGIW